MGRALMYTAIAALAVFVLLATFVLQSGGESIAAVQHVSVHDLTSGPARYVGYPVTTEGALTYSDEHERFEIVAEGDFAILIREYHGDAIISEYVGEEVRVSGTFGFEDEFGVYIDADVVAPVPH
jgi:hypothetical protein